MADERKESVVLEFEVDEQEGIESINALTKANKELRAERNALNLQSEAGKKRAQEINALIDQNTSKIKANVSAIEKQKINIGNYKSALDGVHPALGKVGEGLEAGTKGFMGMVQAAKAFILTPIGAILAALVAVFTLLKTAISTNNEVLDKFENITNAIGVVVDVLVNRVGKLGQALIALSEGNFSEAINLTSQAFTGLADEIAAAVAQGQLYLDLSRELEDAQRALRIETARQENEIKRLVVASKNRNLTLDEQEDKLRKALALEEQLVAKRAEIAERDLVITAKRLALEKSLSQTSEETFQQFLDRLIKGGVLADEQVDEIVGKIEALEQARGSSLAFQEKLENNLAAIQEKRVKILEDQAKALEEQARQERAVRRSQNIEDTTVEDPLVGAFQTQADLIDGIDKRLKDDLSKRDEQFQQDRIHRAEIAAENVKIQQERELAATAQLFSAVGSLFDSQSAEYKAFATAQALISTFAAAQKAFEAGFTPPTPASPALAALYTASAVATGLANVARINGIQFAEGGWTGPGPKMKAVGVVHADEYVAPKWVVHKPEAQVHLAALERIRGGYVDGGFTVDNLTTPVTNQQLLASNIIKNMPPVIASWEEGRRIGRRLEFKEKISKR